MEQYNCRHRLYKSFLRSKCDNKRGHVEFHIVYLTPTYRFYRSYHPSCAILPSSSSFIAYSNECPFLFWTVMFTAMRGKSEFQQLFLSLVEEIYTMAYDCIRPKGTSFYSMQALLLLCYWHPPFNMLSNDPSNAFINMATHIGLRLGLHRPGYAKEFDARPYIDGNMLTLRRITWVACFVTNVR